MCYRLEGICSPLKEYFKMSFPLLPIFLSNDSFSAHFAKYSYKISLDHHASAFSLTGFWAGKVFLCAGARSGWSMAVEQQGCSWSSHTLTLMRKVREPGAVGLVTATIHQVALCWWALLCRHKSKQTKLYVHSVIHHHHSTSSILSYPSSAEHTQERPKHWQCFKTVSAVPMCC